MEQRVKKMEEQRMMEHQVEQRMGQRVKQSVIDDTIWIVCCELLFMPNLMGILRNLNNFLSELEEK